MWLLRVTELTVEMVQYLELCSSTLWWMENFDKHSCDVECCRLIHLIIGPSRQFHDGLQRFDCPGSSHYSQEMYYASQQ